MSEPDAPEGAGASPGEVADPAAEAVAPGAGSSPPVAPARSAASRRGLWALLAGLLLALGGAAWWSLRGDGGAPPKIGEGGSEGEGRGVKMPLDRPPLTLSGSIGLEKVGAAIGDLPSPVPEVVSPSELGLDCQVVAWQAGRKLGETDECDAQGGWRLEIEGEHEGQVSVEHLVPGRLRGVVSIEVEGRGEFELPGVVLGDGYLLAGQVLDSARQPLEGVEVQAMPQPNLGEPEPWRAWSDAQGNFRFDTLPEGPVNLNGSKGGYASSVVDAVTPDDGVLLILDDLVALRGELIADAALLERARVRLEGSAVWPPLDVALAGDVNTPGAFVFEGLVDGIYGVEVYVPADRPGAPEFASVPLENVEPSMQVTLGLVPAYRVAVQVVDPEGAPVPGAKVTVGYDRVAMLQKLGETDLEGRARVGPVVPGPYWVRAEAEGFLPAVPQAIEVGPEAEAPEPLVLARPATVRGVVEDEAGHPVADAEIWVDAEDPFTSGESFARAQLIDSALGLRPAGSLGVTTGPVPPIPTEFEGDGEAGPGALGFAVQSDEEGAFEIEMLPPGKYELWARHGSHAQSRTVELSLVSGELREGVKLVLREGQLLSGRVLDGNGQPILGTTVEVGGELWMVDESGAFDAGLWRGPVDLIVRAPGMVPLRKRVTVGRSPVDLELQLEAADGRLELRLVDGNGRPIEGVEVMVQADDDLSPTAIAWSDEGGALRLEALTKGKSTVRVEHPDFVPFEKSLRVDDRGERIELVLDAGWELEVLVREAQSGRTLEGASVTVDGQTVSSDEQGVALVRRLDSKRAKLRVSKEGWGFAERMAARPAGEGRGELVVELVETGSIEGRLTDDIGEPVAGAEIRVYDAKGRKVGEARSDAEGAFVVQELPEGEIRIEAEAPLPTDPEVAPLPPLRENSDVRRGEITRGLQLRFERP